MLLVDLLFHLAMSLILGFVILRQYLYQMTVYDMRGFQKNLYMNQDKVFYTPAKLLALSFMLSTYTIYYLMNNVIGFLLTMLALIGILTCFGIDGQPVKLKWHPLIKAFLFFDVLVYLTVQISLVIWDLHSLFMFGFLYLMTLPLLIYIKHPIYQKIYQHHLEKLVNQIDQDQPRVILIGDSNKHIIKHMIYQMLEEIHHVTKNSNFPTHYYDFLRGLPKEKSVLEIIDIPDYAALNLLKASTWILCGAVDHIPNEALSQIIDNHITLFVSKIDPSLGLPLNQIKTFGQSQDDDYKGAFINQMLPKSTIELRTKSDVLKPVEFPIIDPKQLNNLVASFGFVDYLDLKYSFKNVSLPRGFGHNYLLDELIIYDTRNTKNPSESIEQLSLISIFSGKKILLTDGYDSSQFNLDTYLDMIISLCDEIHLIKGYHTDKLIKEIGSKLPITVHKSADDIIEKISQQPSQSAIVLWIDHLKEN